MSLAAVLRLQQVAEEHPSVETYSTLVREDLQLLAYQRKRLHDAEARKEAALRRKQDLLDELAQLSVVADRTEEGESLTEAEAKSWRDRWLTLLMEFTTRKEVLTFFLSYSAADLKHAADLDVVSRWLDTWSTFSSSSMSEMSAMKRNERRYTNSSRASIPSTSDLTKVYDEVCRLQLQARSLVGRERYRRSTCSAAAASDFFESQQQLMEWCQKQCDTVTSLSTLEDYLSFTTSFRANVPVMNSNFLVLMEQGEPFAEDRHVQQALREVHEAWIYLALVTYEKLYNCCRSMHSTSLVEKHSKEWAESVGKSAREVLVSARGFLRALSSASDLTEKTSESVQQLDDLLTGLLRDHGAHNVVCVHISDFNVREECLQPHWDALRHTLLSSLTSTVMSFSYCMTYEGREEYQNLLEELQEWLEVKAQKATYGKLLDRLEDTKATVEQYADILFPDEEA